MQGRGEAETRKSFGARSLSSSHCSSESFRTDEKCDVSTPTHEPGGASTSAPAPASFVSPLVRLLTPGSAGGVAQPQSEHAHVPSSALEWVLYDFISFAHAMRLDCCFLRGYESLPTPPPNSKVHLLVRPVHVGHLMDLFEQAARRHGASIIDRWSDVGVSGFTLYSYRAPAEHGFVEVDVHTEITCAATPYLAAEEVLPGRHYARDVRIPLPVHEAVIHLLDRWLGDGELAPEDAGPAEESARRHPRHFEQITREILGKRLARELVQHVAEGRLADLFSDAERFRRAIVRRAWMRAPLRCAGTRLARSIHNVRLPLERPRGRFIAVVGRDVAARFDILEWLATELRFIVQGRASIVEPGPAVKSRAACARELTHEPAPGGAGARELIRAWFRCLAIYGRSVLPHRGDLSLVLRADYPYAEFMEPMRAGVRRGSTLARLFAKCMPHPDVVLALLPEDERGAERACEVWALGPAGFSLIDVHAGAPEMRDRIMCALMSGGASS